MCGLAGVIGGERTGGDLADTVREMCEKIAHRGPDDSGVWCEPELPVALGLRRLSIQDPSPAGHQPMASACGRWVIAYNGEVYNFKQLRRRLDDEGARVHWRGGSDTEVILAAIAHWGLTASLERFVGMFAFALWDRRSRRLTLVRDRLGIKPLYYGRVDGSLGFGSELSAVAALPGFERTVDRRAIAAMMRLTAVPAPLAAFAEARKLPPGSYAVVPLSSPHQVEVHTWWDVGRVVTEATAHRLPEDDPSGAVDAVEQAVSRAVKARMVSDVPVGVFLSGGIDSSLVTAMMQRHSDRPVRTYSLGIPGSLEDESGWARRVAEHLGTEHREVQLTPDVMVSSLPEVPRLLDEPFIASSFVPTWMVARLAREDVKVVLCGDGGDELFGGYRHHWEWPALWRRVRGVPLGVRGAMAGAIGALPRPLVQRVLEPAAGLPGIGSRLRFPLQKLDKGSALLRAADFAAMEEALAYRGRDPAELVVGGERPETVRPDVELVDWSERLMFADMVDYLPGPVLTKTDRATMVASMEGRVPLLDHRLVELAWRLPPAFKTRERDGKWILKQVLARQLPRRLFERPKAGFGITALGDWLRGPLRDWAEEQLEESRMRERGVFDADAVRELWRGLLSREHNDGTRVLGVVLCNDWLEQKDAHA